MEAVARVGQPETRVRLMELTREYQASRQEFLDACDRVLSKMHLLGGDEGKAFETEFAAYLGVKAAKGVASGTDALRLAVRAAGLEPGDEVLIQGNAFMAAVEALYDAGVRPIPIDVRESDFGPDPAALAAAVTDRTRGILVVHLYGFPVDLLPILALAERHDLVVLEDCSHAHGAELDGRRVGSFGRMGAFSLGVVKNLAAYGDAGVVSTNDPRLADTVRFLGTHGQVKKNHHEFYGGNSRLDELHAAMLRVKMRQLDVRTARRQAIATRYSEAFGRHVPTPPVDPRRTHVFHQYVIRTDQRAALQRHLDSRGVETGIHYPTPIHLQPAWEAVWGRADSLPVVERLAGEILSLPIHPDLTDDEVTRVIDGVQGFFA
jgi:dTDP-4-amino-4,6-dideoxygalactose transaminase